MIDRLEIMEFSREVGLSPEMVEKDYVLAWLLEGIYRHPALGTNWLFKGGTCLKKCYFETYRFSEDLDFTLKNPDHLQQKFLDKTFAEVADWIYEQAGIESPGDSVAFEIYKNPRGKISVQGRIGYRGPLRRRGSIPRIKLDLTNDERIVLEPVWRTIHHPYDDCPDRGFQALCYSYEELFAEKFRALAERMRPRDLYDIVHLYRHGKAECDRDLIRSTLKEKCDYKGMPVPDAESLASSPLRAELESEWQNMLAHQLPQLPPIVYFLSEIPRIFNWLAGTLPSAKLPPMPLEPDEDPAWHPPAMVHAWRIAIPLEIIRFAAANHLCIDLSYGSSRCLVEPYALRRTRDGKIILHAVERDTGKACSFWVDRMERAPATGTPFDPRYAFELT